ncbi:DNA-directed RNA polymerase subunit E'' [Candidatus Woesearchaeota archaeon]|nr:MAG: DNA-directed RNA polymerase subunit E'' [Candidatus Woesearchaeota archaeon]
MAKKKVCKSCRALYDAGLAECPLCGSNQTATSSHGRIYVSDPEKSFVAQQVGIKRAGEYAIKVR